MRAQELGDLGGGLETVGRVLGKQTGDDRGQPVGDFGIDFLNGPGRVLADALEDGHRAAGPEGHPAGTHRIEDATEAEEICAVIDRLAARLLGGHVLRRAGDGTALGQAGVIDGAGQAEVGDLDTLDAVFEQDVGRLDVAVDQPLGVGRGQPGGRLETDAQDLLDLQRAALVETLLERDAGNVFHHQVGPLARPLDGVNVNDMFIAHGRGRLRLADEALAGRAAGGQRGSQHLDCHHALKCLIERLEHHAHAAAADDFEDLVMPQPAE